METVFGEEDCSRQDNRWKYFNPSNEISNEHVSALTSERSKEILVRFGSQNYEG